MKTSRSHRISSSVVRFVAIVMAAAVLLIAMPTLHPVQGAPTHQGQAIQSAAASGNKATMILGLLDRVEPRQLTHLVRWPAPRLARLQLWLSLGITFEGDWTSDDLDQVLTVLDRFGATYGDGRFAELVNAAATTASDGLQDHLGLTQVEGASMPAAYWHDNAGDIEFLEGFLDDDWFAKNYDWVFLHGSYAHPSPDVTMRQVVIGHELGHVLIDGLRVEAVAAGRDPQTLETLYGKTVEPGHWPHVGYGLNESLATELSVWALGVERTPDVDALRAELSHNYFVVTTPVNSAP